MSKNIKKLIENGFKEFYKDLNAMELKRGEEELDFLYRSRHLYLQIDIRDVNNDEEIDRAIRASKKLDEIVLEWREFLKKNNK